MFFIQEIVKTFVDHIFELQETIKIFKKEEENRIKAIRLLKEHIVNLEAEIKKKDEDHLLASQKIFDEANKYKLEAEALREQLENDKLIIEESEVEGAKVVKVSKKKRKR